ncbi:zinc finger CCHC domain-containing protein 7-like isoform X1 [Mugil cephalus]|uniref:zinc finger CCHC domain-containing protein 7-like isoform X1 n=1 Tax=Mugil cephalus TaxID=48193 RepID=UPI001FB7B9A7|nr:zinc finger CCHC domain-containing protein 7-like isoform X1 [Mugil cephalus]
MDGAKENEVGGGEEAAEDDLFFIGDSSSSEGEINFSHQHNDMSCKQATRLRRESSPPLLLAFSVHSARSLQDTSLSSSDDSQEDDEEDGDQPIEEWMILEEEEQVGDSSIQLNLSYGNSSEDDSGDEDTDRTDKNVKPLKDIWDVSDKDKYGAYQSLTSRYFAPGRLTICHVCNRTGHLAKSCYFQKVKEHTCLSLLRAISSAPHSPAEGHIRRDCPGRPCSSCGLPFHGLRPCEMPPVWNQHCQRCGITGHLSDACPDTWRQYHLTIRLEVPLRPQIVPNVNHKRFHAHCYNCSKKGHFWL